MSFSSKAQCARPLVSGVRRCHFASIISLQSSPNIERRDRIRERLSQLALTWFNPPPRAVHVPSTAFRASSCSFAGSASCAPTAPTTSQFRSAQTSGMLANQVERNLSGRRIFTGHTVAGFLTIQSRGARVIAIFKQSSWRAPPYLRR